MVVLACPSDGHCVEKGGCSVGCQMPVLAADQQQLVHQGLCEAWRTVCSPLQHLQACDMTLPAAFLSIHRNPSNGDNFCLEHP